MISDVAQSRCSEQCVTKRVYGHVGIAVAKQSQSVVHAHTAKPQFAPFGKFVDIKSVAHPYGS